MKIKTLLLAGATLLGGLGLYMMHAYGVIGLGHTKTGEVQVIPTARPTYPKVLLLGTSLTSRGKWVRKLEEQLAGCGVSVERLARPAANSQWGLSQLHGWYAAGNRAGMVIVEFSGNDASPVHGMPLVSSRRTHNEIVALARKHGSIVTLATMNPGWNMNAIERPGQDRYHAMYRDIAGGEIGLIDTVDLWRDLDEEERRMLVPDDLHPTEGAMVKITLPNFKEHIEAVFCPD